MTFPIYFDEDFSHDSRRDALRANGWNLLLPSEVEMLGRSDEDHIRYAASFGRLVVSHNQADFAAIHWRMMASGEHHSGICLVRMEDWFGPGELERRLRALADTAADLSDGLFYLSHFG